jgi:hypothetical protein
MAFYLDCVDIIALYSLRGNGVLCAPKFNVLRMTDPVNKSVICLDVVLHPANLFYSGTRLQRYATLSETRNASHLHCMELPY